MKPIVLVEDSHVVRKVASIALAKLGHAVHIASTVPEAVELLRAEPDAVLVLDVMLDALFDETAVEVYDHVRAELGSVPLVVQSSLDPADIDVRLLRVASAVVRKPWPARSLSAAVEGARVRRCPNSLQT